MKLKITLKTPKNQAEQCIRTQQKQMLGWKLSENIIESKVTAHNEFYWIADCNQEQYLKIANNCAKGEILIKNFYKTLIKWIDRGNKLATKFKRSAGWVKKWIIAQAKKHYKENESLVKQIEDMKDEDLANFLRIDDREEMIALLAGDLYNIKVLEP